MKMSHQEEITGFAKEPKTNSEGSKVLEKAFKPLIDMVGHICFLGRGVRKN